MKFLNALCIALALALAVGFAHSASAQTYKTVIEVVVPKGTTGLVFIPNANRKNFDDGRPAVGIALIGRGEPLSIDPNFVIQRVTLDVPVGTKEAVLCSGHVPGEGYHAYFAPKTVREWRAGKPKRGLVGVVSTADRNRLGPRIGQVERVRGYPKRL